MDERGDGEHNGGNREELPLNLFPRGDRLPDNHHAGVIALLEFLFDHELEEPNIAELLDLLNQNADDDNDNDENQGDENQDNENHEIDENQDNDVYQDNDENQDNNENQDNGENQDNDDNHDNNKKPNNNENQNNNENHGNNENQDNIQNQDNNDAIHNNIVNDNNENAEDAGASAWVEVGVNQGVEDDDPLPGGSKRRSREEDGQDIERSSKKYRWWDEFAESSTDSDTDSTDCYNFYKKTVNSPVKHAKVVEEDPLPGPSRKRTRKSDGYENYRSGKKSRECYKFADKNCDTVTDTTGNDLAHFSGNIDMAEDAGAAEETDKEEEKQLED